MRAAQDIMEVEDGANHGFILIRRHYRELLAMHEEITAASWLQAQKIGSENQKVGRLGSSELVRRSITNLGGCRVTMLQSWHLSAFVSLASPKTG